jgi:hypothetical protein
MKFATPRNKNETLLTLFSSLECDFHSFFRGMPIAVEVNIMNKKLLWIVSLLLLSAGTFADARQPAKVCPSSYIAPR